MVSILKSDQYEFEIKDNFGLPIDPNIFIAHVHKLQLEGEFLLVDDSYRDEKDFVFLNREFGGTI